MPPTSPHVPVTDTLRALAVDLLRTDSGKQMMAIVHEKERAMAFVTDTIVAEM
ncbi:hypothetical protein Q8F55_008543 [Vanrija albida]|uniref:Uncharacterized protein n=1 Tax=Vanrija albida TaxID=181172 RepID=A0ABR3PR43_9TREE